MVRKFWLCHDGQTGQWVVQQEPIRVARFDAEIIEVVEVSQPNQKWYTTRWEPMIGGASNSPVPAMGEDRRDGTYVRFDEAEREIARLGALIAKSLPSTPTNTGLVDMNGTPLYLGDRVRYLIEGDHTKKEYWNPEYEIIWKAPSFTLKHIGGGKDGGSHDFILRTGHINKSLVLMSRGDNVPEDNVEALRDALKPFAAFRTPDRPGKYSDQISEHFEAKHFAAARIALEN